MISIINENVYFLQVRGNRSIRTMVWNKKKLSYSNIAKLSDKYNVEFSPADSYLTDLWLKTKKDNINNLFLMFSEINDNYTPEELKDIYISNNQ